MADREQSIVSIVNVLKAVPTIKLVTRQFQHFSKLGKSQFPCVIVEDDGNEEIEYKSGGYANITFSINLIGYVSDPKTLSTSLNQLDVLVKKTLGADFLNSTGVMRSAGLIGFTVKPLVERSGTESNPYGHFIREIELEYEGQLSEGL